MSIRIIPEAFRHHIKIVSKPTLSKSCQTTLGKSTKNLSEGCFLFFFRANPSETPKKNDSLRQTIFKTYQKHIKILSQSYQNHIKFISKPLKKRARNRPKACPLGYFCFLFPSQPIRSPEQAAPFPNHIKIISKTISKS